jgi:hypothetical protein
MRRSPIHHAAPSTARTTPGAWFRDVDAGTASAARDRAWTGRLVRGGRTGPGASPVKILATLLVMGGRHARGLGRSPGVLVRRVASRVKLVSFAHAMVLLVAAVVVSSVVVGWILLSGAKPNDIAAPPATPSNTPRRSHPKPPATPRVAKSTASAQAQVTLTPTPSPTSATNSPTPSTTNCPPGLKKKLCKRGARG